MQIIVFCVSVTSYSQVNRNSRKSEESGCSDPDFCHHVTFLPLTHTILAFVFPVFIYMYMVHDTIPICMVKYAALSMYILCVLLGIGDTLFLL